jgi:hypothetical protein
MRVCSASRSTPSAWSFVGLAHVARLGHALAHRVEHAVAGFEHRLLRHVADAQALGHLQQAVVELLQPGHHLQQAGLAGAVAADQPQAFTGFQRQAGGIEQGDMAVGEVGVREGEQGHGGIVAAQPRPKEKALRRAPCAWPAGWAGQPWVRRRRAIQPSAPRPASIMA